MQVSQEVAFTKHSKYMQVIVCHSIINSLVPNDDFWNYADDGALQYGTGLCVGAIDVDSTMFGD